MTTRELGIVLAACAVLAAYGLGRAYGRDEAAAQAQQAAAMCRESLDAEVVTRRTIARRQDGTRAAVNDALRAVRDDVAEVGRACREVAETCAVPGVWLDVGVLPLGRPEVEVVRR